jgi:Mg2+ and Co2+ transporter CorA
VQRSDYQPVTLRVISIYATRWRHDRTESDELAPTTVLSVIGVPLGFLVAFFGVNSSDVSTRYSVFNWHHYWLVYRIALVLALVPLGVFAVLHGRTWAQALAQRHRERRQSRLISG